MPGHMREKIRCNYVYSNGYACRGPVIENGDHCDRHSSPAERHNAEAVRAMAMDRLLDLVDPALLQLENMITNPNTPQHVRIKAITDLLDRVGMVPVKKVEKTTPVDEEVKRLVEELRAKG